MLAKGASGSLVTMVTGVGMIFLAHVYLARFLGAETFGIYVYALAWMKTLAVFCKLGVDTASVRFISVYHTKEEWGLFAGFMKWAGKIAFAGSMGAALLFIAFVLILHSDPFGEAGLTFIIAALLLPPFVGLTLTGSFLQALKRVVLSQIALRVVYPVGLVAGVAFVGFVLNGRVKATHVMAVDLASIAICLAITLVILRSVTPEKASNAKPEWNVTEWWSVSLPMLLIAGFFFIQNQTDILMAGYLLGPADAGVYSASTKIAGFLQFGLGAVNSIAAPMISSLHSSGEMTKLRRTISLTAWGATLFAVPVGLVLAFGGEFILSFFGDYFLAGYMPLLILIVGQTVNAFCGSVGHILVMTGHQRIVAWVYGIFAFANVVLNYLLIPHYGLSGAAIATAVTTICWNLVLTVLVFKHFKMNPTIFSFSILKKT